MILGARFTGEMPVGRARVYLGRAALRKRRRAAPFFGMSRVNPARENEIS